MKPEPARAGWQSVTLGEVASDVSYGYTATATTDAVGPRFVRVTDLVGGRIDWGSVPFCEMNRVEHQRFRLRSGDIVVARTGPVGSSARMSHNCEAVFASYLVRFRVDSARIDDRYAAFLLQSPQWWNYVDAVRGGSVQPQLNATLMKGFTFDLPPLDEQRRIAGVLRALDDKIEHNQRLLARATEVIRAWFGAKLANPRDGSELPLPGIARFVNGRAFTKEANGRGRPILRIRELNSRVGSGTPRTDIEVDEDHIARPADLLFSWSGSLGVYRWNGPEAVVNQHIFKVTPNDSLPTWFVESWIRHHLPDFQAIAQEKATTMGHIQRHHLDEAEVLMPSTDELRTARTVLDPLDELRARLVAEATHLASIRDALLAKLVSGKIRVPESYEP